MKGFPPSFIKEKKNERPETLSTQDMQYKMNNNGERNMNFINEKLIELIEEINEEIKKETGGEITLYNQKITLTDAIMKTIIKENKNIERFLNHYLYNFEYFYSDERIKTSKQGKIILKDRISKDDINQLIEDIKNLNLNLDISAFQQMYDAVKIKKLLIKIINYIDWDKTIYKTLSTQDTQYETNDNAKRNMNFIK